MIHKSALIRALALSAHGFTRKERCDDPPPILACESTGIVASLLARCYRLGLIE